MRVSDGLCPREYIFVVHFSRRAACLSFTYLFPHTDHPWRNPTLGCDRNDIIREHARRDTFVVVFGEDIVRYIV